MAYLQYQVESPSGTIRRTGRVAGNTLPVTYAGSSYSVGAGTTTKSCGNKLMKGDLQFSGSANIPCANKLMPNDIVIRANSTTYENYQVFGSSGTFTVPYGVQKIYVCCVGGGGGGAGVNRYSRYAGGGGGGGYVVSGEYNVNPGSTYSVSVGAGGAGGPSIYSDDVPEWTTIQEYCKGRNGSGSSFGSLLTASGGGGCPYGTSVGGSGGCGGGAGGNTAVMFWADRDYWQADYQGGAQGGKEGANSRYGYKYFRAVNGGWDGTTYNADIQYYDYAGAGQSTSTVFRGTGYGGGGGGGAYAYYNSSYYPCYVWPGYGQQGGGAGAADTWGSASAGTANTGGGGGGGAGEGDIWGSYSSASGGSGVVIIYW